MCSRYRSMCTSLSSYLYHYKVGMVVICGMVCDSTSGLLHICGLDNLWNVRLTLQFVG
jgi:hypothetical protein